MKKVEIKCLTDDAGNEYLPDWTETELYSEECDCGNISKRQEHMIMLYNSIVKAENYWYCNTPTAFGNPEYSMYAGIVRGMICGLDWDYQEINQQIIIKSGKRTIMVIQKPKKSQAYFTAAKSNSEIMQELGL
jgi:hypothetical protein